MPLKPTFYEFFAGGGMARLGLGKRWRCLFANDNCPKKGKVYRANFGDAQELVVDDIRNITTAALPGGADLAWASFPCQDLSLAGRRDGLRGGRSGTFFGFWKLMRELDREGHGVPIIALENVAGLVSSNNGADFIKLTETFIDAGYRVGALAIDAELFVPQSRPRLFIIAVRKSAIIPNALMDSHPQEPWSAKRIIAAFESLSAKRKKGWIWWRLPLPPRRKISLADVIERDPPDPRWVSPEQVQKLLSMMSDKNSRKIMEARDAGSFTVAPLYKRTRNGTQRAETRFDDISGCLRVPTGGSSRQTIIVIDNGEIRARLMTPREAARLMGAPENYRLPEKFNAAYHVMGDAVVVPVVSWLERHILHPLAAANAKSVTILSAPTARP